MEKKKEVFPDGTPVSEWFKDKRVPQLSEMGRQYVLKDYGVPCDGTVQTEVIQKVIDEAGKEGGVIVVSKGTYVSGALDFPQGVSLYVAEDGILKGSENISDFPIRKTRIEGQNCLYFPALINVSHTAGFTIAGNGVIDGNGTKYWQGFWLRRTWNPECTNKDEQRPRLLYIEDSSDVTISGVTFQNSPFWTTHIYRCHHVKYIGCRMVSPHEGICGPSTDAIDIDACSDVLVTDCYMDVNDDAVALKGGKGPWADEDPGNGANERIIIENCVYGFCHGCLTFGSESVHDRNIIFCNIEVQTGYNLLWLKFRPDTPQKYEYVLMENVHGRAAHFLNINPWRQFFDLQGRKDLPVSLGEHFTIRNCTFDCDIFFNVKCDETQYILSDFVMEDLEVSAADISFEKEAIRNLKTEGIVLRKKQEKEYTDAVTTL